MHIRTFRLWNWFGPEGEGRSLPAQRGPFTSVTDLHSIIDHMFDNAFQNLRPADGAAKGPTQGFFTPKLDIKASDAEYAVSAELPGVSEKDISLEVEDRTLILSGEKKEEHEDKKEGDGGYYRMERSYGSFRRALALPDDADIESVKADFKDGVLRVNIPRKTPVNEGKKSIAINSK